MSEGRYEDLLGLVRATVAAALGYDSADDIDPDLPFVDQGVGSLLAVEVRERLAEVTGVSLPSTVVFDAPTPAAAARYLGDLLNPGATAPPGTRPASAPADDPVAIVGMACRFPGGVTSPEELWAMLLDGGDAVGGFPADRGWDPDRDYDPDPGVPGSLYVRGGAFLDRVQAFDAGFFGISPREAVATDPQQRLLLETSWEAIERAGIDPASLAGTDTGVYTGIFGSQYAALLTPIYDQIEGYYGTGTTIGVAAGRVAYALGLQGPAMSVDTACSSSLVSLHLAVQALRNGECSLALAGGVTMMSDLLLHKEFCRERALSPDGRCRAFADGADGFGPAEGVGILVVERLSDAVRNGRRVLAVVRGSAVNQDGASNGLTAPNGTAQQRVIRAALRAAELEPSDVDVVEAHGTGTPLGDPIEAHALMATYGQRPPEHPVLLGSVKSNIGHTQAAAGVAGVIKSVLAMRHGVVPRSLYAEKPSAKIDWTAGELRLVTENEPWPDRGRPRRVGISGFGISGTNAHVILEEAEPRTPARTGDGPAVWGFAAKSRPALRAYADRLRLLAEDDTTDPAVVGRALRRSRTAFTERAVVFGADRAELIRGLTAIADGTGAGRFAVGTARRGAGPVLVFPGQGSQWPGMARALLDSSAVFADWIAECDRSLRPYVGWSLAEVLDDEAALARVDVVQPALFAVLVGIARLWEHHGVRPAAVVGHSQGEIAAAYVAGALSLDDAVRAVALRSRAIAAIAGHGGMAALMLGRAETERRLGPYADLSLAAVNGPAATVVSGPAVSIEKLLAGCEADGVWARRIPVDFASHSAAMADIETAIREALAPIRPVGSDVLFVSAVTAEPMDTAALDAGYWYRNLRATVRFEDAVRTLLRRGHRTFIEVSPHPVLTNALSQIDDDALVLPSLHRDRATLADFTVNVAAAYAGGVDVDWERLLPPAPDAVVDLPTYPFERRDYWPWPTTPDPLLDAVTTHAGTGDLLLSGGVGLDSHPWLADHAVGDITLFPGTGFVDLALRAATAAGASGVGELTLQAPMILIAGERRDLQVVVAEAEPRTVTIYSRPAGTGTWTSHASGVLSAATGPGLDLPAIWPPAGAEPIDLTALYARADELGYRYGPAFRRLTAAWRAGDDVYAEVGPDPGRAREADRFAIHPALLDAALHPMVAIGGDAVPSLPFVWEGVHLAAPGVGPLRIRLRRTGPDAVTLAATDPAGRPVLTVERLLTRPISLDQLARGADAVRDGLFAVGWTEIDRGGTDGVAAAIVLDPVTGTPPAGDGPDPQIVVLEVPPGDATGPTLTFVQTWVGRARPPGSKLIVLTRDAVSTGFADRVAGLAQAPVWGLVRSAQTEYPHHGLILLDLDAPAALTDVLGPVLAAGEGQLAVRDGRLLAPALVRATPGRGVTLDPEGTVLITGGLGTLGAAVAEHLVSAGGIRHLLLLGRRGADGAQHVVDRLAGQGAEVTVAACDVADRGALAAVLAAVPAEHPLTGVVHAAGVLDDALFADLDGDRLAAVTTPKTRGAWNLHELVGDVPLFALFSSASGVVGSAGQANYAAANTYLDALAQHRRAGGLPAQSLAWGLWAEASGMTGHLDAADRRRMRRSGVVPMSTAYGLALFDAALGADDALIVTARLDLAGASASDAPMLRRLRRRTGSRPAQVVSVPAAPLATVPAAQRRTAARDLVRASIAQVLGYESAGDVPLDRSFRELGVDSLAGVQLRNQLASSAGVHLPVTIVFDHPTPADLADGLLAALGLAEAPAEPDAGPDLATDEALFAFIDGGSA